jgi:hypothetical protein
MFNPSLPRENIDAQAASTDGRATLNANGQAHMFERKVVIKKHRGGFKYKKNKTIYFFLFVPRAVFEHVYIFTISMALSTSKIVFPFALVVVAESLTPTDSEEDKSTQADFVEAWVSLQVIWTHCRSTTGIQGIFIFRPVSKLQASRLFTLAP